jgi:hypothetical protein
MKLRNLKEQTRNLTKSDQVVSEAKKEHQQQMESHQHQHHL